MTVSGPAGSERSAVVDVAERDFEREVVERSRTVPVVVDFWAPWCGPCRMLGPILERLAVEAAGAWQLAKVNTDENPGLAMRYDVQGIPAVKAFRDGAVVDEFVGAQPEPTVRAFVSRLGLSPADEQAKRGRRLELAAELDEAEAAYREALRHQADHAAARVGLGRVQLTKDDLDAAIETLETVPYGSPQRAEAEALSARARFRRQAGLTGDEMGIRRRVAADPADLDARLALAALQADKGEYREALEALLAVMERDGGEARERARSDMLAIFQVLGDGHDLTREYRPRLAALLF